MSPAPILVCESLTVTTMAHPRTDVVREVSFTLAPGRVLGLIGESGAGKTTLGLAALGHLRPGLQVAQGRMIFEGKDLLALSDAEVRALRGQRIAYVAQSAAASFNPGRNLFDQITETLRLQGVSNAEIHVRLEPLLKSMGLPDALTLARRWPHQLSGGQLQRAMIAMAMLPKPSLVVFDEPTTALDTDTQADVMAAMDKALKLTGAAALYISHDLDLVCSIADRIMVLRNGRMVEQADSADLRAAPRSDYARALLAARQIAAPQPVANPARVLQVEDLSIGHARQQVLFEGLSFTIDEGEVVALTGPSGSGKSSVMRAISGLDVPRSGTVRLRGNVLQPRLAARGISDLAAIQIVHQLPDLALNPSQSIRTALMRGLRLSGRTSSQDLLEMLMADVELDPALLDRYPGTLSGGQKQRVCIARALAAQPDVLICDEPTAALDPLVAKGVLLTLSRIQEERRMACLMITHDRELVTRFCHREVRLPSA